MDRDALAAALCDHAYLEGDFLLRSGRRSKYYLDKYRFETRPDLLGPLGEQIAEAVQDVEPGAVRLAGPELGAVALAASASLASGLPFLIVRKEAKGYGTGNRLEGVFEEGELACLVEDVVTSGGAAVGGDRGAPRGVARGQERGLRRRSRGRRGRGSREHWCRAAAALPGLGARRSPEKCRKTAWLSEKRATVRVFRPIRTSRKERT